MDILAANEVCFCKQDQEKSHKQTKQITNRTK